MEKMPKTDPRTASPQAAPQPPKPQALSTASTVQSEVVAVTQQLATDVSADAYAIGQQSAEYVNQQAFTAFLKGFNEGAASARNPFSQLRQQLSASKPQPITLLPQITSVGGSTNTALPEPCPPSASP
jgi:flagellar biosynthesis/type III secretory pathway protein FliH